nr:hypothetical protein [Zea mays]
MIFIVLLTVASVLFSHYCVGDRAFMRTGYDFEGYVMRKFAVCVDSGLPKRAHHDIKNTNPHEVRVEVVEEVHASEPSTPALPLATPAPPTAPYHVATGARAEEVPSAAEEEQEEDEDWEDDGDDEEFDFEEEGDLLNL